MLQHKYPGAIHCRTGQRKREKDGEHAVFRLGTRAHNAVSVLSVHPRQVDRGGQHTCYRVYGRVDVQTGPATSSDRVALCVSEGASRIVPTFRKQEGQVSEVLVCTYTMRRAAGLHMQALERELKTAKTALESRGTELKELRKEHFELKSDRTVTTRTVKASEQHVMRLRKQVGRYRTPESGIV